MGTSDFRLACSCWSLTFLEAPSHSFPHLNQRSSVLPDAVAKTVGVELDCFLSVSHHVNISRSLCSPSQHLQKSSTPRLLHCITLVQPTVDARWMKAWASASSWVVFQSVLSIAGILRKCKPTRNSLEVQGLGVSTSTALAGVQSLARELRPCKLCSQPLRPPDKNSPVPSSYTGSRRTVSSGL